MAVAAIVHPPIAPEDQARADLYALLARLYARPPDEALLARIAAVPQIADDVDSARLPRAFNALRVACAAIDARAADDEYTALFVGIGRADVDLHASHWVGRARSERPLVKVRGDLARLGLARLPHVETYEDHLAALCETMRVLVAGEGPRPPATIDVQRQFFDAHFGPWVELCCDAISKHAVANMYRWVAELTTALVAIERDAFAIE
jgi:TorA maturation chaperone TorD